jgi:hypothetical protein
VSVDLPLVTVAADGDLIKSDTLAPGAKSQQFSIGAELRIPVVAIRAGAMRNFAATDPHWTYSVGVGFGVPIVSVDASILLSPHGGVDPTSKDREDIGGAFGVKVHF